MKYKSEVKDMNATELSNYLEEFGCLVSYAHLRYVIKELRRLDAVEKRIEMAQKQPNPPPVGDRPPPPPKPPARGELLMGYSQAANQIAKALGLPENLRSFSLKIEAGKPATVEALVFVEDLVVEDLVKVLKQYELYEIESGAGKSKHTQNFESSIK